MIDVLFISMFLLGVGLILVGVNFALKGKGAEDSGATGAKVISIKGPAWLIVIVLGVVLCGGTVWLAQNPTTKSEPQQITTTTTALATITTVRPSLHAALDALYLRCQQGEMLSCDDLVTQAEEGSTYHKYGLSCGGRTLEASWRKDTNTCVATLGLTG